MKRRAFLKVAGAAAGGLAWSARLAFADPADPARELIPHPSGLPRRRLGKTGVTLPIVGFPGLCLMRGTEEEGRDAVRWSLENGCDYFDTAPAYGKGVCEIRLGQFLEGVRRDSYFLACKTQKRDAAGAREELERSLTRLKTDHFDLYQMHVVTTETEARQAVGPGGALETMLAAQKEGKVRWLGFSSHSIEAAMILLDAYPFTTVMHPVNFVEHYQADFCQKVLDRTKAAGAVCLAIKPISSGKNAPGGRGTRNFWYQPLEDEGEIALATRFALSLDPVVSAVPTSFYDLFRKTVVAARSFKPATSADFAQMEAFAKKYAPIFNDRGRLASTASDDAVPGLFA
jgi:aryl-alcohol dehydrogenase-like predicted oxidoreductase